MNEPLGHTPADDGEGALPGKFRRNVLTNYGTMLALLIVALFTTPLLAHGLGPERYGVWAMVGAIIPYLEILELGFASTTVALMGRHLASEEPDRVEAIFNTSLFALMIPGLLCFCIACGVAVVLPHMASIAPSQVAASRTLVILLGFDMAVSIPGDTFGSGLIALQRFDLLNASLAGVALVQGLSWFLVIRSGGGLVALGVVTVVISLAGQVTRFLAFRRLMPDLQMSPKSFDRRLVRSFARLSGWFSLSQIISLVTLTVDVVIVGVVVGVAEAGIFAVGQRLSMLAANSVDPVTAVFMPASSHTVGRGDEGGLRSRSLVITGNRVVMGVAVPVSLVTAVLARPALRAWVGPLYVQASLVAVLLCAAVVVQAATQTSRAVLAGAAEPRVPALLGAAALVVHVVLAIVLGRHLGIVGVAAAALISGMLFGAAIMVLIMLRRYHIAIPTYIALLARAHLLPVVCAGAIGIYLARGPLWDVVVRHSRVVGLVAVIVAGLIVLAVYLPIYAYTGLSSSERSESADRLWRFLRGSK